MDNIDKEIIKEDLEFVQEYLYTLRAKYPELLDNLDTFVKIERRIRDIEKRLGA